MSNSRLDQLIRRIATVIEGDLGNWRINYGGRHLFILTDEAHNATATNTTTGAASMGRSRRTPFSGSALKSSRSVEAVELIRNRPFRSWEGVA